MSYYIDGTIDSIELAIGGNPPLKFSLLPSAEFLKTVAGGKKRALFIGNGNTTEEALPAILAKVSQNENGKEKLDFTMEDKDLALKCLLLEAKKNRNTIRVFVQSTGRKSKKAEPVFPKPISIALF